MQERERDRIIIGLYRQVVFIWRSLVLFYQCMLIYKCDLYLKGGLYWEVVFEKKKSTMVFTDKRSLFEGNFAYYFITKWIVIQVHVWTRKPLRIYLIINKLPPQSIYYIIVLPINQASWFCSCFTVRLENQKKTSLPFKNFINKQDLVRLLCLFFFPYALIIYNKSDCFVSVY